MRSERPSPRCALALIVDEAVAETAHGDRLSAREAARLAGFANPRVRRRWLAGRLAAKYLVLGGAGGPAWRPAGDRLVVVDGERLRSIPAARYRELELLAAHAGGAPRLCCRGVEPAPAVSISHRGGLSCAAVAAPGALAGIDLETVAQRAPAFHRLSFSDRERAWAEAGAERVGVSPDWLYTLLWTVKEAALKSGATAASGVWDLAAMEIELPADLPARLAASRGRALGERFTSFSTAVHAAGRGTVGRVETSSTRRTILSLFTAFEAPS